MSYDIRLKDKSTDETLYADFIPTREGTYAIGHDSARPCTMNITYNYQPLLVKAFGTEDGVRTIYGMTAKESIPVLESAMLKLGNDADDDYWKPTEGNVKQAIAGLLAIARSSDPEGVWSGD